MWIVVITKDNESTAYGQWDSFDVAMAWAENNAHQGSTFMVLEVHTAN
jgi:hypothetical protein